MGHLVSFAIISAIMLAVEYAAYRLFMARTTLHSQNRAAILLCYAIALAAPFALSYANAYASSAASLLSPDIPIGAPAASIIEGHTAPGYCRFLPIAYLAGVIIMSLYTLIAYMKVYSTVKSGHRMRHIGCRAVVVVSDSCTSPFSFGKYIVVNEADSHIEDIIAHELTHIRLRHGIDVMIGQFFLIFNWFNPFAYLMRSQLHDVHEYEVDEIMLAKCTDPKCYQKLLIYHAVAARGIPLTNNFNHSQLKTRIIMMKKQKTTGLRRFAAAMLLPAAAIGALLTQLPAVAAVTSSIANASFTAEQAIAEMNAPATIASPAENADEDITPDVAPSYAKGEAEMYHLLAMDMAYPPEAVDAGKEGRVIVGMTINTDGTASDFEIRESSGTESLDKEALRAVSKCLKDGWKPGLKAGKAIACSAVIPVNFRLPKTSGKKK